MLAVFAGLCAIVAALFGIGRLFTPSYAKVTAHTLEHSITRAAGGGAPLQHQPLRCRRLGSAWGCPVPDTKSSGGQAQYKVQMTDAHCWDAVKTIREHQGKPLPTKLSDCVLAEDKKN
jgi:hypothetical protein